MRAPKSPPHPPAQFYNKPPKAVRSQWILSLANCWIEYVDISAADVLVVEFLHCTGCVLLIREENQGVASGPAPGHVNDHILLLDAEVADEENGTEGKPALGAEVAEEGSGY